MTDRNMTLVSLFAVGRYAATCAATVIAKEPFVSALWTATLLLAGGMMLFLVTACQGTGLTV